MMPNHVETTITILDAAEAQVKPLVINRFTNEFDFGVLVPIPPQVFQGDVSTEGPHKLNALNWCSENWGTKWNAYGGPKISMEGATCLLSFTTAWSPPYYWMTALLNALKMPFSYVSKSEGESFAREGIFCIDKEGLNEWREEQHALLGDDED